MNIIIYDNIHYKYGKNIKSYSSYAQVVWTLFRSQAKLSLGWEKLNSNSTLVLKMII